MRRAAARWHTHAMALLKCGSSRPFLGGEPLSPAAHAAPRCAAPRRLSASAAAAPGGGGGGPRQQQQQRQVQHPQQHPPQHPHQHHSEAESLKDQWKVRRTRLSHFPEETQRRILSGRDGQAGTAGHARTLASAAGTAGASWRGGLAELASDVDKLLRTLEYERGAGFVNVVGSVERVPMADWAARHLRSAAEQLQQQAGAQQGGPSEAAEAASECTAAAQRMAGYGGAGREERQAILAEAEQAARRAMQAVQLAGRSLAGRQSRHAPPASQQQPQAVQQQAVQQQQAGRQQQPQPLARTVPAPPAVSPAAPPKGMWAQQWRQLQQAQQQGIAAAPAASLSSQPAAAPAAVAGSSGELSSKQQHAQQGQQQQQQTRQQPARKQQQPSRSQHMDRELDAAAEEAHAEETADVASEDEEGQAGEGRDCEEGGREMVVVGGRKMSAQTAEFRRNFALAAAAAEARASEAAARGGRAPLAAALESGVEQRSQEWLAIRERRLTASAFSKAIGLFDGDRQRLWEEKVGLVQPFAGNAATAWGTQAEPQALESYETLTGQAVTGCMFQVRHDDFVHGWLGASPDGLIESLSLGSAADTADAAAAGGAAAGGAAAGGIQSQGEGQGHSSVAPHYGAGVLSGPGRGILEIKCPFNKGQPELAQPPPHATWYYMPQVQGLMYIFDCDWCNLYIWTPRGGSAVYHIRRDRAYWSRLWEVLADFWWTHVVPARQEFVAGRFENVEDFRPSAVIELTDELRQWSKALAKAAPVTFFPRPVTPRPFAGEGGQLGC